MALRSTRWVVTRSPSGETSPAGEEMVESMSQSKDESGRSESTKARATTSAQPTSDRERYLANLIEQNGQEWVDRHKGLIDDQLAWIESL